MAVCDKPRWPAQTRQTHRRLWASVCWANGRDCPSPGCHHGPQRPHDEHPLLTALQAGGPKAPGSASGAPGEGLAWPVGRCSSPRSRFTWPFSDLGLPLLTRLPVKVPPPGLIQIHCTFQRSQCRHVGVRAPTDESGGAQPVTGPTVAPEPPLAEGTVELEENRAAGGQKGPSACCPLSALERAACCIPAHVHPALDRAWWGPAPITKTHLSRQATQDESHQRSFLLLKPAARRCPRCFLLEGELGALPRGPAPAAPSVLPLPSGFVL